MPPFAKDRLARARWSASRTRHRSRPGSGRAWRPDYNRLMAQITVRFFARYAQLAGCQTTTVAVPLGATVGDVVSRVRETLPGVESLPQRPLAALNQRQVKLDTRVSDGDEVALLPPLSGG